MKNKQIYVDLVDCMFNLTSALVFKKAWWVGGWGREAVLTPRFSFSSGESFCG